MSLEMKEKVVEQIAKQIEELLEDTYQDGIEVGRKNGYTIDSSKYIEQGRNEAWEAAKKIFINEENGGLKQEDFISLFDCKRPITVLAYKSATEVISKIKAYEEHKKQEEEEIKIGDEVVFPSGDKFIVISLSKNDETFDGLYVNGNGVDTGLDKSRVAKTGRYFPEIAEVMKKMQEDKE